ncbi:MAG: hypothetical protein HQL57_07835 [Magnetococcales bacterium]|nr:hypothetical protein [Magnetococcales bacterium]MBF0157076.1 hypothetical protein [Magnetococcales bacterium]
MISVTQKIRAGLAVLVIGMGSARADGVLTPAHGGKMVESHGQRLELTVRESTVDLFLADHGNQPISAMGATGKVVFLVNGKRVETAINPAGENRLSGNAPEAVTGFSSAVITVERDGKPLSARISATH